MIEQNPIGGQIPPLATIRFFDATARHSSVKLAAQELHVTPGAVSQQLRKLESFLGCALFERGARGLALTQQGRDYHGACRQALALIGAAGAQLARGGRQVLHISCTPGFAAQWLVPRLQGWQQAAGAADVQVSTTNRVVDLAREGVHFAVRHGLGQYPGLHSQPLLADDLIAVCSPALVAPRRRVRLADIRPELLLHDGQRGDWQLWCAAAGVEMGAPDGDAGIVFVASNAVVEAALAGRGFALLRRALVQAELGARRLLALAAPPLRTPLAYHLVYHPQTLLAPAARAFCDWLLAQAGQGGDLGAVGAVGAVGDVGDVGDVAAPPAAQRVAPDRRC